ncbi:MAG: NTP transferase domain-containing protein [Bacteroidetes bacterium]|nr:NTP transferase domain-containing protein [Bacteroidota bacterium]
MHDLYGLVLTGGKSSRMGAEKGLLDYHGKPQQFHVYDLLRSFCKQVFISCRADQLLNIPDGYEVITDEPRYSNIGPMAGLLSAHKKFPEASFLVTGCDYPFLTLDHLAELVSARNETNDAICFLNPETNIEEPLIAIYENRSFQALFENFESGKYSLRHFLREVDTKKVVPVSSEFLKSVDDMKSFHLAKRNPAATYGLS